MNYWDLLKQSWNDFWGNLILIVPQILQAIVAGIVGVGFIIFSFFILLKSKGLNFLTEGFEPSMITGEMIPIAIVLFVIFLIIMLVITTWFQSGFYQMLIDVVQTGSTSWKTFKEGTKRFKDYFCYQFIIGIVWMALVAPLIVGVALIFSKILVPGIILSVIGALVLLILGIIISFGIFFAQPLLFFNKLTAMDTFRQCIAYVKQHFVHALATFAISIAASMALGFVLGLIVLPVQVLMETNQIFEWIYYGLSAIKGIIQMLFSIMLSIFLFHAYAKTKEIESPSKKFKKSSSS